MLSRHLFLVLYLRWISKFTFLSGLPSETYNFQLNSTRFNKRKFKMVLYKIDSYEREKNSIRLNVPI